MEPWVVEEVVHQRFLGDGQGKRCATCCPCNLQPSLNIRCVCVRIGKLQHCTLFGYALGVWEPLALIFKMCERSKPNPCDAARRDKKRQEETRRDKLLNRLNYFIKLGPMPSPNIGRFQDTSHQSFCRTSSKHTKNYCCHLAIFFECQNWASMLQHPPRPIVKHRPPPLCLEYIQIIGAVVVLFFHHLGLWLSKLPHHQDVFYWL